MSGCKPLHWYMNKVPAMYCDIKKIEKALKEGAGEAEGIPITQQAVNYSALSPGTKVGDLAYVTGAQGTAWLPGTVGGSYYPAGLYLWDSANWVSDRNAIVNQLELSKLDNVVHVNSLADFPAPIGGSIELVQPGREEVTYLLSAKNIDVGNIKFTVTGGNVVIRGAHRTASKITSTSLNTMFTCVNSNFFTEFIGFHCPSTEIWLDWSSPEGLGNVFATQNTVIYNCGTVALIDGAYSTSLRTFTVVSAAINGILWSGYNIQLNISQMLGLSWTGTLLDLGTATFDVINLVEGSRFSSPAGTVILSGEPDDGNLNPEGRAIIDSNLFNGVGEALEGIKTDDLRYDFKNNVFADNITPNTLSTIDAFLAPGGVSTDIATAGVYYPLAGVNWLSDVNFRFTLAPNGVITYIGLETIPIGIAINSTIDKTGGGHDMICTKIAINDVLQDKTIGCSDLDRASQINSSGFFAINTGDTIRLYGTNEDNPVPLVLTTSTILINKL